jgi:hypothetical protein
MLVADETRAETVHLVPSWLPGDHDGMARMKDIYTGAYSSKAICEAPHRARGQLTIQETNSLVPSNVVNPNGYVWL